MIQSICASLIFFFLIACDAMMIERRTKKNRGNKSMMLDGQASLTLHDVVALSVMCN